MPTRTGGCRGLEHPLLTLAVRLQFEFAARMSEILLLEWEWVDFDNRRVVWPDSKTGDISKPMSEVAFGLLSNAYRIESSRYVCPSIFDGELPMPEGTYVNGWKRILKRSRVPHVGDPVQAAAEKVANLRRETIGGITVTPPQAASQATAIGGGTRTSLGNYRLFRHRKEASRAIPPDTKRAMTQSARDNPPARRRGRAAWVQQTNQLAKINLLG